MSDLSKLPAGLRAFLDDDVALLPAALAEGERALLIEILLERADVGRLDRLGASPDKAIAKAARKALHLLSTRGKQAPTSPRVFRTVGPYAEPAPASYASIIDGRGERVVWYVEAADSGFAIWEIELSESAGVMSVTSAEVTRKAWREQVAQMKKNERAVIGEIDGTHARVLVERAYRQMKADGRSAPEAFARAHVRVQASDEALAAPHPLAALVAGEPAPTDAAMAGLLERIELSLFVPPRESLGALDAAIGEVVGSKVVLDPAQKIGRLEDAVAGVADKTLDGPVRKRFAERLRELGLLILGRQPDAEGRAAARACLAAAERAETDAPAREHPTLLGMFRRLVPAELMLRLSEPAPSVT